MDHRREAFIGFLVACGHSTELFEVAEEIFDEMAPAVHMIVARDGLGAIGFWRNDRHGAAFVQRGAQPIGVEGFVGKQRVEVDILDQGLDADTVMTLARHQDEAHQVTQRIDQRHDFGCQTAARPADGLILSPPFAPAPCWWTRMIVPSIITYSKSGSPDNASKIESKTPFCAHRRKRRKTEFQLPKPDGRSRHGAPVRATHKTASTKSRLSVSLRPGSPSLPGTTGAIRSHCTSLNTVRSKTTLHWVVLNQIAHLRGIPRVKPNVHRP